MNQWVGSVHIWDLILGRGWLLVDQTHFSFSWAKTWFLFTIADRYYYVTRVLIEECGCKCNNAIYHLEVLASKVLQHNSLFSLEKKARILGIRREFKAQPARNPQRSSVLMTRFLMQRTLPWHRQFTVPEGNSHSGWVSQYILFRMRETRTQ